ncbi:MAG: hypothetical protein L6R40_001233 [Gallowayella cf. fulva]|nr:MAG: hypothetical protein L6R40_001233 [Xanthomendoza cf. fulva]
MMAVEIMRIPAPTFAQSDVELFQPAKILRKHSTDQGVAFIPLQPNSPEELAPRASARSVNSDPLIGFAEDVPSPKSAAIELVGRRGSPVATGIINEDIEGIISQLDQTKIQTAGPISSRIVQVPKGFGLGMAFDISKFYQQRSEARRHDKRKRDLGVLPKQIGPQKHGFRPEELLWYGAIDLKDCKGSSLDNDIHPLLDRDRFDDTPDYIYDQLIPGLRLASLFLSHPSCMQFWVTLAKGDRRLDHIMTERYHKTRHRITRNVRMTKENVEQVIGYIRDLGEAKAIHFTFAPDLAFQGSSAFGTAHTICNFQSDPEGRQAGNVQSCVVRLHSDFYVIAKKLSTMIYPDPTQKLRFNFIFATLIAHEMAHAIELSQWRNRAPSPFEPFLLHYNDAELGRVWETYMFGGQVAPINDRVDGIYGVATWNWPRPFGEMEPERTICYALPMEYIAHIQQKSTWEEEYELEGCQTRFHVPRDGATSIYMNSVTTVSWTEEERAAKETLQEQQVQDSEEPAKKKRETADGHALPIQNVGTEPEAAEKPQEAKDLGTTAQQVNRVKREPKSVMSNKQRRLLKKKTEKVVQKKAEIEEEVLLDLEEPNVSTAVAHNVVQADKSDEELIKDEVIAVDDVRGTDTSSVHDGEVVPDGNIEATPATVDGEPEAIVAADANEETPAGDE